MDSVQRALQTNGKFFKIPDSFLSFCPKTENFGRKPKKYSK